MKKSILYVFCLSLLSWSALAQIDKGASLIGGSIGLSYQEEIPQQAYATQSKTTTINVAPSYARFVATNFCIGARLGTQFTQLKTKSSRETTDKTFTYSVGPFVRYYVPVNQKLYAFGDASFALGWVRYSYDHNPYSPYGQNYAAKDRNNTWALAAGVAYFLSQSLAVEIAGGFTHNLKKETQTDNPPLDLDKTNTFGVSVGFNIYLHRADPL